MRVTLPPVYGKVPTLRRLAEHGIECDQILAEAIRRASEVSLWCEAHVLYEIAVLCGSPVIAGIDIVEAVANDTLLSDIMGRSSRYYPMRLGEGNYCDGGGISEAVLNTKSASALSTLTTNDFLHRVTAEIVKTDGNPDCPFVTDFLREIMPHRGTLRVSENAMLAKVTYALPSLIGHADDIELILALDPLGRLRIRTTRVLGDFAQKGDSGLLVPTRAMLVHHQTFGSFTAEQIAELEELINASRTREQDLQDFFERNPHFFRRWDHRAVYPHVYLTREEDGDGPLIPDFILTNQDAQQAFVVELKLPGEKLILRQRNRDRFSAAVMEAKSQLLEYRDWFEDNYHREKVKRAVGMEIFRPQMAVVIGRSTEFRDELDRQKLRANEPGIEVVTYDDILGFAKRRQLLIETGQIVKQPSL